jgi:threonylcarbamoyladenosine tRNA methylthiotransferase MtaB
MPEDDVLRHIHRMKHAGYHEVVLSGIHLGSYGLDLTPASSLSALLKRIDIEGTMHRVRLSSIEPRELTPEIIQRMAQSHRFCRHFHIPLQSGDDRILKKMHRPYNREFFRDLVWNIHTSIPDAAIGVDTLIGFPGETDTAFENTYKLIEELPVTYLHVFPFSARKGTPACHYSEQVDPRIIKTRCQKMRKLGIDKEKKFYHKFINKKLEILIEEKTNPAEKQLKGITSNYIPVHVKTTANLKNQIVQAQIQTVSANNRILGTLCEA